MLCLPQNSFHGPNTVCLKAGLHHAYRSITRTADLAPPLHRLHAHAPASGHRTAGAHAPASALPHYLSRTYSVVEARHLLPLQGTHDA